METKTASYREVKSLPEHPDILLIDVRDAAELHDVGRIPTSINIPLNVLKRELKLTNEEFKSKYKRAKPQFDTILIFSCRSGMRAQKAKEFASNIGFKNTKIYSGSWREWARKEGIE